MSPKAKRVAKGGRQPRSTATIPPEYKSQLELLGEQEKRSISWLIADAVREYLEKRGFLKQ